MFISPFDIKPIKQTLTWGVSRIVVANGPTNENYMLLEFLISNALRGTQNNPTKKFNSHDEAAAFFKQRQEQAANMGLDSSAWADPDQWYYDAIEKYKGTSIYDRLLANPHLFWNNEQFQPNLLQQFGEGFGDYQARMAYYEDLRNKANSYLSDQVNMLGQTDYDSAVGQVAREKLAGLNPDINGGQGITAGAAAENDQPAAPPSVSSASSIADISSFGLNFVSSVFGMVEGIQGMIGNQGRIAAQDIANHTSVMGFVQDELLNTLSVDDISDPSKIDEGVILNLLDSLAGDSSFNSSTRKIIKRYRNEVFQNSGKMATLRTELAERYLKARKGTAEGLADPYYEKKLADWVGRVGELFQRLNSAVIRETDARESKAIYDDTKFSAADGALEGSAMNEEAIARGKVAKREGTAAENEESALQVYNELVQFLQEDDSIWSKFGLYFMPKLDNLLNTLSGGGFKIKFDSSDRSRHSTVNGGPTYKTGPTVINN